MSEVIGSASGQTLLRRPRATASRRRLGKERPLEPGVWVLDLAELTRVDRLLLGLVTDPPAGNEHTVVGQPLNRAGGVATGSSYPSANPPPTAPTAERLKLSQRVILHIYSQGRLHEGEVATTAFTQAGMSEKLGVGQSPLSNVLRRLVVGGVLVEDVRHVFGRPRRLRVYRLTAMGESLALELRRRADAPRSAPGSRAPVREV